MYCIPKCGYTKSESEDSSSLTNERMVICPVYVSSERACATLSRRSRLCTKYALSVGHSRVSRGTVSPQYVFEMVCMHICSSRGFIATLRARRSEDLGHSVLALSIAPEV